MEKARKYVAILAEEDLERVDVVLEAQRVDRVEQVLTVDCLALFILTLLASLARDEADELGDALLHCLLRLLRDLRILRQHLLHDPADVRDWQEPAAITTNKKSISVLIDLQ